MLREPLTSEMGHASPGAVDVTSGRFDESRHPGRIFMTKVSLVIPGELEYEDWERAGRTLAGMLSASAWCLGDWLVYGMKNHAHRYQQAVRTVGLQYQTLRNYSWVARRFEVDRRRVALSFQHHAEVASLEVVQQEYLLDKAESLSWTTRQLRVRVSEERVKGSEVSDEIVAMPRVRVPRSHITTWEQAAERAGTDLRSWLVAALDQAAEEEQPGPADPASDPADSGDPPR